MSAVESARTRPLPPLWIVRSLRRLRNGIGTLHRRVTPPPVAILESLAGPVVNRSLGIATDLDIAEHLAEGPRDAAALARLTATDAHSLERVLRTLTSLGFFRRLRDGRYANNGHSELLREQHPESLRDFVLFFSSSWIWDLLNHAPHAVRTGESGVVSAHGVRFFEYMNRFPEISEHFDRAMAATSRVNAAVLASRFDFSPYFRVCDVGGGTGTNLREILSRNAHLEGVLFDVPGVAERAAKAFAESDLRHRSRAVGGDFFQSVPEACDLYMFQAVLHDWDDEECLRILGRVRAAAPKARVLVLESLLPEGRAYDFTRLVDVWMLLAMGSGRERTRAEFQALFARAGYRIVRTLSLPTLFQVMELTPH